VFVERSLLPGRLMSVGVKTLQFGNSLTVGASRQTRRSSDCTAAKQQQYA